MADRPTPRYGHAPIALRRRLPDLTDAVINATPYERTPYGHRKAYPCRPERLGDFYWHLVGGRRKLCVTIPTGPGAEQWSAVAWPIDHQNHLGAQWRWDGNEDAPTLSPSLHWIGVWHGWVRAGQLVEA